MHKDFYARDANDKEADVTHIIPKLKKNVLKNVIIAFTDVIPQIKDPKLSWIWQMATSFGAICSMDLTGKTTHLIAVKSGSKVKAAREYGHSIHIVTPAWLLDSTARWSIQDEENYGLPEVEIENPESTPLDLEDEDEEEQEVVVDWEDADREVEDFINESGIDDVWDTDSDTTDRYNKNRSLYRDCILIKYFSPQLRKSWKRKRENNQSGGESGGDDDSDSIILAVRRRARATKRGKSHLSKVTTAPSSQCTTDDDLGSLDDLVEILDDALE